MQNISAVVLDAQDLSLNKEDLTAIESHCPNLATLQWLSAPRLPQLLLSTFGINSNDLTVLEPLTRLRNLSFLEFHRVDVHSFIPVFNHIVSALTMLTQLKIQREWHSQPDEWPDRPLLQLSSLKRVVCLELGLKMRRSEIAYLNGHYRLESLELNNVDDMNTFCTFPKPSMKFLGIRDANLSVNEVIRLVNSSHSLEYLSFSHIYLEEVGCYSRSDWLKIEVSNVSNLQTKRFFLSLSGVDGPSPFKVLALLIPMASFLSMMEMDARCLRTSVHSNLAGLEEFFIGIKKTRIKCILFHLSIGYLDSQPSPSTEKSDLAMLGLLSDIACYFRSVLLEGTLTVGLTLVLHRMCIDNMDQAKVHSLGFRKVVLKECLRQSESVPPVVYNLEVNLIR